MIILSYSYLNGHDKQQINPIYWISNFVIRYYEN